MELNMNLSIDITDALNKIEGLQELLEGYASCEEIVNQVTSDQFKSDIYMASAALILAVKLGFATSADLASAVRLLAFVKENK